MSDKIEIQTEWQIASAASRSGFIFDSLNFSSLLPSPPSAHSNFYVLCLFFAISILRSLFSFNHMFLLSIVSVPAANIIPFIFFL